ncbi:MAG TPA: exopolysaccharide biosynthesis protein [Gaiellales bacterium]|nr:exopolysaccharide biosynthesis protein [Gaiellales bacterium]
MPNSPRGEAAGHAVGRWGARLRVNESFSDELERWLRGDEPKTLGALTGAFEEKSFAVTILLLMFVPALPVPTGGVTHVFEAITVILAAQLLIGRRTIWLPDRLARRGLGATMTGRAIPFVLRWVRRVERVSHARGAWLFRQRWMLPVFGLVFIALAVAAGLAPPFSGLDTLPAMGAIAVALAIIFEDVLLLALGFVLGTVGVVLIVTIGAAIVHVMRNLV